MGKKKTLLFLNFFLIIFSINFVMSYSWSTYGNDLEYSTNAQFPQYFGSFDENIFNISIGSGQDTTITDYSPQPLVVYVGSINYLVLQNGNFTEIYDKDLILLSQTLTGVLVSNLDTLFYTNDTSYRNIAGMFYINSTALQLRIYTFNHTTGNLSLSFYSNFTSLTDTSNVAGLRHSGKTLIFAMGNPAKFYRANETAIYTTTFPFNTTSRFIELISWVDMDNDGIDEYLGYTNHSAYVFNADGLLRYQYITTNDIGDAKLFQPDQSPSQWRLAIAEMNFTFSGGVTYHDIITIKRLDGSTYWISITDETFISGVTGVYSMKPRIAITDDYDGDNKQDLYVSFFTDNQVSTNNLKKVSLRIYKGTNGVIQNSSEYSILKSSLSPNPLNTLTIADMNGNGHDTFINSIQNGVFVWNPFSKINYFTNTLNESANSGINCIPADLSFDSFIDIICTGRTKTYLFSSNITNSNPNIVSVVYDPSTTLSLNEELNIIITANDSESNIIKYNEKCNDTSSWGIESTDNIRTCSFGVVGTYNVTIGVKDDFHSFYRLYSQNILVTTTGSFCNNNDICESGETVSNCPNDCTTPPDTTQTNGGMSIPTQIVNVDNVNQGLLPEVYYGILGFLSNTLSPMIILIFVIFTVMIMLTIGTIIKKIAQKVGN